MRANNLKAAGMLVLVGVISAACSSLIKGEPDERWADYKSWTKITEARVATGDPTGFIGNVHKGREGYRDVYVNGVGKDMLTGTGPYVFPAGTIIVKEQFSNKADWEAQKGAEITVSLKEKEGSGSADNWIWAAGISGKAEANAFCSGCHAIAAKDDFVFTHEAMLSAVE